VVGMTNNEAQSAAQEIPANIDVTLTVPLDALLGAYTERVGRYTGDPDDYQDPPAIVLDAIGERVAQMLFDKIGADARESVRTRLNATIVSRIEAIVDAALDGEFQPVNPYGEKSGKPTTVRGLVIKLTEEWFNKKTGDYREQVTNGEKFIRAAVEKVIKEDLEAALGGARAQVTQRLKDRAAEAMAATIAKMSGV
jgi:hypothetical protein